MGDVIKPRTLGGFRDFLPETMLVREQLMETSRRVYRSFGYAPIDTPALEYFEILSGKGGEETDRQMYQFEDHGGRHVGMRFDLTVPLARYCAQHINELGTPFKRYHIGPVWRGERQQAGRYREFIQSDFDTVGSPSIHADIETALVIHDLMQALGFDRFVIRFNNRKVLNGFLEQVGWREQSVAVLRAIDKLEKIGEEGVANELRDQVAASDQQIEKLLKVTQSDPDSRATLARLEQAVAGNELGERGVEELQAMAAALQAVGLDPTRWRLDASIARGLDYYTGTIYETTLLDLPGIGSVCSGGRYDNLAELFTKQQLPGVGASLGLDRLLAAMDQLGMLPATRSPARVFIAVLDPQFLHQYLQLAGELRQAGIATEVYPDIKKLGPQLKYADRKGFEIAIIAGEAEFAEGKLQVKDLVSGQQEELPRGELIDRLRGLPGS